MNFRNVLIEKHFRGLVSRTVVDLFWDEVQKHAPYFSEVNPVIATQKYYLLHVLAKDLFFLAVVGQDVQPLLVFEFLHRVVKIFRDYFGGLNDFAVKDNFITAYQLLDEMNDGGIPFNLEPNILEEMIAIPNIINRTQNLVLGPGAGVAELLPEGSLSQIPWRKSNVKYTTNEIYLDIVDEIDAIIESNGAVTTQKIVGKVVVDCQLSGVPDLVLRLRNPMGILDDVAFHPCVRLSRWEREQVVSFVPPDGKFQLMSFRTKGNITLPLYVKPQVLFGQGTGTVHVMVGTKNQTGDRPIEDITVTIKFASNCGGTTLSSKVGTVNFDEATKVCVWKIKQLPKNTTPILEGTFSFDTESVPVKPTVLCNFRVNMWSASGLKVESLTLLNEKYNHFKGVKSITQGGHIQVRL